jgi:hypothetical protein
LQLSIRYRGHLNSVLGTILTGSSVPGKPGQPSEAIQHVSDAASKSESQSRGSRKSQSNESACRTAFVGPKSRRHPAADNPHRTPGGLNS